MVPMVPESMMVFAGNANPKLAQAVTEYLHIPLGRASVARFSDGEVSVQLLDTVRGKDVFVLQSTCAPTNDNLMELLIMVDALKRASARRITAAIPYYGYARQDRRPRSARVAISAKVVANMLQSAGVDHVLTMDLHADQIQGFFDIPVDNIYATPVLLADLHARHLENPIVVSPDVGGVVRARAMAKAIESDLAIIDKRRPRANVAEIMNIIGDVKGRTCIITDDIVDTAGTLCNAAGALKERGALGRRDRSHYQFRSGRTGCDGYHSALACRPGLPEDPPGFLCGHHRRNPLAHRARSLREQPVRGVISNAARSWSRFPPRFFLN